MKPRCSKDPKKLNLEKVIQHDPTTSSRVGAGSYYSQHMLSMGLKEATKKLEKDIQKHRSRGYNFGVNEMKNKKWIAKAQEFYLGGKKKHYDLV